MMMRVVMQRTDRTEAHGRRHLMGQKTHMKNMKKTFDGAKKKTKKT